MQKNFQPIPFKQLKKFNDSNSFVWTALDYEPKQMKDIEKWLKETEFLPEDAKILDMRKISGNVLKEKGRTDVLFLTTNCHFNPIKRLMIDGLTWTSDFIDNYRKDSDLEAYLTSKKDMLAWQ